MKKKIMAVTLCLAMVSTFAVGCGQKNETDSGKSEEKSSGKVEIEFVQVKREAAESYTKVIEAFEKENPDIVIKQNVVPDAQEVLMTRAKTMYFYLLAGIFVPFQVIMVPLVKYLAKLKLCNIPGLIIMCVTLASSQGVFLLVNYIRSVPRDLEEAAYIDGCGTVKAYVKIVLPMIKPILATIFVLNALWVWNDFQMPLLILNQSQDMWTLPLFQYNFKSQYSFDYNLAFASYLIAMIPVLIAYACAQKHIVSGLTQGAVKS